MRADFYEQASCFPALASRLTEGNFTLAPPAPDALALMIRGPAQRAGAEAPDELLAALIADAGTATALPLVAFVLPSFGQPAVLPL